MCGIAGMVGPGADARIVARMTAAQAHRGPDGEGLWSAPSVALGHRRLKVIDLSDAGRQPMSTPDGRYTIVYNGEVYNHQELKDQLSDVGFRSRTDTEVVLHAYIHWGPACLEQFVGMYGLAIWDSVDRQLFCARDRLGIKPFYYAEIADAFVFASEIRPLLIAGVKPEVNHAMLYDFLARDFYDHTDETFFAGINKLPPGSWMLVKDGKPSLPQPYWKLDAEVTRIQVSGDAREREQHLMDLCKAAVASHLCSDVPVGVALSGGLDSATLLALLDETHSDPSQIEAFSFTFADPSYSERPFVQELAKRTGRPAYFTEVSPQDFAATAERFTVMQEEPFAGAPISAYALCFEAARRQGFIVMMDGSGMDEGLAGYERFRPALWADLFVTAQWQALERELVAAGITTTRLRAQALIQMRIAMAPQADTGRGQDLTTSVRADCLSEDFVAFARRPVPDFERCFTDNLRNLMYRELRYTKLPRALRFRDKLSMAVGTELRPPFLDHRLLAYEFALPADDRISRGTSKAILRRAAARLLPDTVRLASKRSVQTPQREWFRNELKEWVRERIDTPSFWNRGWINRRKGIQAMDSFLRGEGDNSFFLWQWVNLEIWAQRFLAL
jgi:asparagine synthase (glutamine-hydrolysing)